MVILKTTALFFLTALLEIVGCYLAFLWLKREGSTWLLVPSIVALVLFSWLLTLHPTNAGRTYAAYGGVYIATAILWLWIVEGIKPDVWDLLGTSIALVGMAVIMFMPRS
jgi:small multidrug resistance family-3 protein